VTTLRDLPRFLARTALTPTSLALIAAIVGAVAVSAALGGRGGGEPRVPVAVVNNDVIVTTGEGEDEQTVAAGRAVAADLTGPAPDDASLLDFTLTDENSALAGLESGGYYAVVIIPEDFSADVSLLGTDDPVTAQVRLQTNSVNGRLVGEVSEAVTAAAAAAFGGDLTVQYLESSYESQGELADGLGEAASGASDIEEGTADLSTSSQDLAEGAASSASGAAAVSDSAQQLLDGTDSVSSGARSVSSGADGLADGASRLAGGSTQAASASADVAAGADDLAGGLAGLAVAAKQVDDAAGTVDDGATQTSDGLASLQPVAAGSADASAQLAIALAQLAAACPPTAGPYCDQVEATVPVALAAAQQAAGVSQGVDTLAGGAAEVSEGTGQLVPATQGLAQGASTSEAAAAALAEAAASSATAAADVSAGAANLTSSSEELASGAADLSAGSDDVADGTYSLASGADEAAVGAADVADGADSLNEGADSLTDPTTELATSLDETAAEVPNYDEAERELLSQTVAAPVSTTVRELHPLTDPRASVVPLAILVALVSLLAAASAARSPLPEWAVRFGAGTGRIILVGLRPGLGAIAVAAAATLVLPAIGIGIARPLSVLALTAVGGLALLVVYQAIVSLARGRAPLVGVVLLALQLLALPWGLPIDLSPTWVQTLNQVLPIPVLYDGLNAAVVGADQSLSLVAVLVLIAWTAVGLLVTTLTIPRAYRRIETPPLVATA
jgi:putative membrane protein